MQKRLEIYVTFACNNNCLFCVEKEKRRNLNKIVPFKNKQSIIDYFKNYKAKGYNHVNLLGGEPFWAKNILDILKIAKGNNFKIALATNGSLLADEKLSRSALPLIDDLIVSIHGHNQELVAKQSQNQALFGNLLKGLENIRKYFSGRLLKANCVVNRLNYLNLVDVLKFIKEQGINEVNFTAMDIKDFNKNLAVNFSQIKSKIKALVEYANLNNIILKFAEFPPCILGDNYHLSNDLFFEPRDKFEIDGKRDDHFLRGKIKPEICKKCSKEKICPGLDNNYYNLFGDKDLNPD